MTSLKITFTPDRHIVQDGLIVGRIYNAGMPEAPVWELFFLQHGEAKLQDKGPVRALALDDAKDAAVKILSGEKP